MAETKVVVGVDVGGTNTDAVVVSKDNRILSSHKTTTSDDVTNGIVSALECALRKGKHLENIFCCFYATS